MPIAVDRFASEGQFATYDRFAGDNVRIGATALRCRVCDFEPEGLVPPRICPKCFGSCWERFVRPGLVTIAEDGAASVRVKASSRHEWRGVIGQGRGRRSG